MTGALNGFAVIFVLVAIGYCTARFRVLGEHGVVVLARLVYSVATPALLFEMLAKTPMSSVFSPEVLVAGAAVLVIATTYFFVARLLWHKDMQSSVLGMLAASYANSTNLGIPIAAFILGGQQYVTPLVLFQMVFYQPFAIMLLSLGKSVPGKRRLVEALRGFANPMLVGGLLGVAASATGLPRPVFLDSSLAMIGAMTVPSALLVFGMSFVAGSTSDQEKASRRELWFAVLLKSVAYPVVAYALARFAFGLDMSAARAATVLAALPTANMVYVLAVRHNRCQSLARDVSLATTLVSIPVVFAIVWFFG
ncbi:Auxin Efflux Carrier [Segniliparus rotundus DSM 44985]|uniref:Auxin Efflux Carrier n=1 Tax=Segniliparus rotundus (strain ATCC BAA-972 / CDC 1076 / CIP 108378 / DSM 44985 / JCM 13578) TaxID=640132 RepID=D6ZFJ4_SEGRD|nr:AEC family transporter [Segniliparus rotundus]ADG97718.1 Auxin Efflux Carrier [Segniliparus rotundus DSM 44985]